MIYKGGEVGANTSSEDGWSFTGRDGDDHMEALSTELAFWSLEISLNVALGRELRKKTDSVYTRGPAGFGVKRFSAAQPHALRRFW